MFGFPEAPLAWWQTRGMARRAGVNLPRAVVDGWMSRAELGQIVARCAGCGQRARCDGFLALPAEAGVAGFCPNKPALEALVSH